MTNTSKKRKRYEYEERNKVLGEHLCITKLNLAREDVGISSHQFNALLRAAGYIIPRQTLSTWKVRYLRGEEVFSGASQKNSGRQTSLNEQELKTLAGWVVSQNLAKVKVDIAAVQTASEHLFNVTLSASTVCRYMAQAKLTKQKAKTREGSFKIDFSVAAAMYVDVIERVIWPSCVGLSPGQIGSIDATYTSHRLMRPSTYAPTGGYVSFDLVES